MGTVTLYFRKSASAAFMQILSSASTFPGFSDNGGVYSVEFNNEDIYKEWDMFASIFLAARKWSSFRVKVDGNALFGSHEISSLFENLQACRKCYTQKMWGNVDPEDIANETVVCCRIKGVDFKMSGWHPFKWYNYGRLVDGYWQIQKDDILHAVVNSAKENHAHLCNFFDLDQARRKIDSLPDTLDIAGPEWEKTYETYPVEGQMKTTIKNIRWAQPEKNFNPDNILNNL
jgi:hypothetical protein